MSAGDLPDHRPLLIETQRRLGDDCWRASEVDWDVNCSKLNEFQRDWWGEIAEAAASILGARILNGVVCSSSYFKGPAPIANLVESWAGEDRPHTIYFSSQLCGARPEWEPCVTIELHIGYESLREWRWLVEHWRRLLDLLLSAYDYRVRDNGFCPADCPQYKSPEYHGKNVLQKVSNYLHRSEGDRNQTFGIEAEFNLKMFPKDVLHTATVLWAVYDSLRQLTASRARPDELLKHYLVLQPLIPRVPFRRAAVLTRGQSQSQPLRQSLG
ncbi:MAG: hypothetical protein JO295_03585 [Verrucomicrobia bacterium]|nr:hypothetical protein [Verrucomicrobiota bacterium]